MTIGGKVEHVRSVSDLIADGIVAAKGAALITGLLIVGIIFAVFLADKAGRIWLQVIGFVGCAVGLLVASFSFYTTGSTQTILIFAGFMLFNFMTNLGPNAQTYLLAGEVFPTSIRGIGAGCGRKDWCCFHRISFSDSPDQLGNHVGPLYPGRDLAHRGSGHLDVPD